MCYGSEYDHESSKMRRPQPTGGLLRHGGGKLTLRMSSIQSLAAHRLIIAAVTKVSRIVSYFDDDRREKASGKDRTERKHRNMVKNQKEEGTIRKLRRVSFCSDLTDKQMFR